MVLSLTLSFCRVGGTAMPYVTYLELVEWNFHSKI